GGSNTHLPLDVAEFRGFALADDLAPLIFINGADSKSAQMFTLGHELAHLWLGETGISDTQAGKVPEKRTERWCNLVAAELLVPVETLHSVYQQNSPIADEIQLLASHFKVSTLVALRRLYDAGYIDQSTLWNQHRDEQDRLRHIIRKKGEGGGNAYNTIPARASRRFSRAIISSALEGMTSF